MVDVPQNSLRYSDTHIQVVLIIQTHCQEMQQQYQYQLTISVMKRGYYM